MRISRKRKCNNFFRYFGKLQNFVDKIESEKHEWSWLYQYILLQLTNGIILPRPHNIPILIC